MQTCFRGSLFFLALHLPTIAFAQVDVVINDALARLPGVVPDWDAKQMIGPPNSPLAADQVTAWAPATLNEQKAWAEVEFAKAFSPAEIHIHECCSPGAVYQVTAFIDGKETVIWKGVDPTPPEADRGISKIPVKSKAAFNKVRIYLNCRLADGWNEIDAVALVEKANPADKQELHWAVNAKASCTYNQGDHVDFSDPFQTDEGRRAEQIAVIMTDVERLKQSVRAYEKAIEDQNAKIKDLYEQLDQK